MQILREAGDCHSLCNPPIIYFSEVFTEEERDWIIDMLVRINRKLQPDEPSLIDYRPFEGFTKVVGPYCKCHIGNNYVEFSGLPGISAECKEIFRDTLKIKTEPAEPAPVQA